MSAGGDNSQRFSASIISAPLNFAVLMNPERIRGCGITDSGCAIITGKSGSRVFVKVIPTAECPASEIQIPESVRLSIGSFTGDLIAVEAFSTVTYATAIQVEPLFDPEGTSFSNNINEFLSTDSHPVAIGSTFLLTIDGIQRVFRVKNCLPNDHCIASRATKVFQSDPPPPFRVDRQLCHYFADLYISDFCRNQIEKYVKLPLTKRDLIASCRCTTNNAIFVCGPSGSGKTVMLSAIENSVDVPSVFLDMKRLSKLPHSEVMDKLDRVFGFAQQKKSSLLLFDDIDAVIGDSKQLHQKKILALFMFLLDRALETPGTVVVASAISKYEMPPELMRYGRFGHVIDLSKLTDNGITEIIEHHTAGYTLKSPDLIKRTCQAMGPREIASACRLAIEKLMKESRCKETDLGIASSLKKELLPQHFGYVERPPPKKIEKPPVEEKPETHSEEEEKTPVEVEEKRPCIENKNVEEPKRLSPFQQFAKASEVEEETQEKARKVPFGAPQNASSDNPFSGSERVTEEDDLFAYNPFANEQGNVTGQRRVDDVQNPFGDDGEFERRKVVDDGGVRQRKNPFGMEREDESGLGRGRESGFEEGSKQMRRPFSEVEGQQQARNPFGAGSRQTFEDEDDSYRSGQGCAPFGAPSRQPFSEEVSSRNPFGAASRQPFSEEDDSYRQTQTRNPFGAASRQPFSEEPSERPSQTRNPFGAGSRQSFEDETNEYRPSQTRNPFGAPSRQPFSEEPLEMPGQTRNPFGAPSRQPFSGEAPPEKPSQTRNPFGAASRQSFEDEPDSYAPGQARAPFGAPARQPFSEEPSPEKSNPSRNPFGAPSRQPFSEEPSSRNPFGAGSRQPFSEEDDSYRQIQTRNPFGAPSRQPFSEEPSERPNQSRNPFGAASRQSFEEEPDNYRPGQGRAPFGAPSRQPFSEEDDSYKQTQTRNPFGAASGSRQPFSEEPASQKPNQSRNPFGAPSRQPFSEEDDSYRQTQARNPFGSLSRQPFSEEPDNYTPGQGRAPFGAPSRQPFSEEPDDYRPNQTRNPFGAPSRQPFSEEPPSRNPFGGGSRQPFSEEDTSYRPTQTRNPFGAPSRQPFSEEDTSYNPNQSRSRQPFSDSYNPSQSRDPFNSDSRRPRQPFTDQTESYNPFQSNPSPTYNQDQRSRTSPFQTSFPQTQSYADDLINF